MHAEHISTEEYELYNIWTFISIQMTSHPHPSIILSRKIALKITAPRCHQTM